MMSDVQVDDVPLTVARVLVQTTKLENASRLFKFPLVVGTNLRFVRDLNLHVRARGNHPLIADTTMTRPFDRT